MTSFIVIRWEGAEYSYPWFQACEDSSHQRQIAHDNFGAIARSGLPNLIAAEACACQLERAADRAEGAQVVAA